MISKELLSEVLKIDKRLLRIDEIKENYIFFYTMSNVGESENYINIYELAHKCKEWGLSKGYILMSSPRTSSSFATCEFCKNGKCDYEDDLWNDFRADTEPEAIFKACQWILNNKES